MRGWIRVLLLVPFVAGCATPVPVTSSYSVVNRSPNVNTMSLPTSYTNCLRERAHEYNTEWELGLSCRVYLDEYGASLGLSAYNQVTVTYGLDARAKAMRERAIEEARPQREAERKAAEAKEKGEMEARVRMWANC